MHDSDDWRGIKHEVSESAARLASLAQKVENMASQVLTLHGANEKSIQALQGDLEEINHLLNGDTNHQGIVTQLAVMHSLALASERRSKTNGVWIRWGLGIIIALLLALFGEAVQHKLQALERLPEVVRTRAAKPQDATIPSTVAIHSGGYQ